MRYRTRGEERRGIRRRNREREDILEDSGIPNAINPSRIKLMDSKTRLTIDKETRGHPMGIDVDVRGWYGDATLEFIEIRHGVNLRLWEGEKYIATYAYDFRKDKWLPVKSAFNSDEVEGDIDLY